jgi:hypothetical protein
VILVAEMRAGRRDATALLYATGPSQGPPGRRPVRRKTSTR